MEERSEEGSVQHEPVLKVRRCFYTGAVLNHTDSFASLDACGGLVSGVQVVGRLSLLERHECVCFNNKKSDFA